MMVWRCPLCGDEEYSLGPALMNGLIRTHLDMEHNGVADITEDGHVILHIGSAWEWRCLDCDALISRGAKEQMNFAIRGHKNYSHRAYSVDRSIQQSIVPSHQPVETTALRPTESEISDLKLQFIAWDGDVRPIKKYWRDK